MRHYRWTGAGMQETRFALAEPDTYVKSEELGRRVDEIRASEKRLREALASTFDALRSLRSCASRWDPEAYQTEIEEADAAIAHARPVLGYVDPSHATPPAQGGEELPDTSPPASRD